MPPEKRGRAGDGGEQQVYRDRGGIGTGDADRDFLRRLASSQQASVFAQRRRRLVQAAFGHIARVIAEGGSALRVLS